METLSGLDPRFQTVAEHMDPESENVANLFSQARTHLSEAERIFEDEVTSEHRQQWPNTYRLESAAKHAQAALAVANPHITQVPAAEELVGAATQARDAIRAAVDSGGGDLIGSANRLLSASSQLEPGLISPGVAERLEETRREIEGARAKIETEITEAGAEVAGQKDQAFAAIKDATEAVNERREAAEQQARELGLKTSAIAAENLAEAYAPVAKETEEQAKRYTQASLATYLFSIVVAGVGILFTAAEHTPEMETFVARAALGVPFALLGAYIASLATTHRREAWRLRHIELQIKTANPFLGLLDTDRREETLAALAIRFFPGQEGVSFDGESAPHYNPELIELLWKLLQRQGNSGATAPAPPGTQ